MEFEISYFLFFNNFLVISWRLIIRDLRKIIWFFKELTYTLVCKYFTWFSHKYASIVKQTGQEMIENIKGWV